MLLRWLPAGPLFVRPLLQIAIFFLLHQRLTYSHWSLTDVFHRCKQYNCMHAGKIELSTCAFTDSSIEAFMSHLYKAEVFLKRFTTYLSHCNKHAVGSLWRPALDDVGFDEAPC